MNRDEAFQQISSFVQDLRNEFVQLDSDGNVAGPYRALERYYHLIFVLKRNDEQNITRHLNAFQDFCIMNKQALNNRDASLIRTKIVFKGKIFIDIKSILEIANEESKKTIWQYLIVINAYVNPTGDTNNILQEIQQELNSGNDAPNFNPMQLLANLPTGDLMGMIGGLQGLNSGMGKSFNMNMDDDDRDKLLNSFKNMFKDIITVVEKSDDPFVQNIVNVGKNMMDAIDNDKEPDITEINNLVGQNPLLSSIMGSFTQTIETDQIPSLDTMTEQETLQTPQTSQTSETLETFDTEYAD